MLQLVELFVQLCTEAHVSFPPTPPIPPLDLLCEPMAGRGPAAPPLFCREDIVGGAGQIELVYENRPSPGQLFQIRAPKNKHLIRLAAQLGPCGVALLALYYTTLKSCNARKDEGWRIKMSLPHLHHTAKQRRGLIATTHRGYVPADTLQKWDNKPPGLVLM